MSAPRGRDAQDLRDLDAEAYVLKERADSAPSATRLVFATGPHTGAAKMALTSVFPGDVDRLRGLAGIPKASHSTLPLGPEEMAARSRRTLPGKPLFSHVCNASQSHPSTGLCTQTVVLLAPTYSDAPS